MSIFIDTAHPPFDLYERLRSNHTSLMHIVQIVAGTNTPSNSSVLADEFCAGIRQTLPDCEVRTYHLRDVNLAHFSLECYGKDCPVEPDFAALKNDIQTAAGVLISTPVWNFGVPAHLKNLIDRMGAFALDESHSLGTFNGKPFYLIFTGGMPAAAWPFVRGNLNHISNAISYFGGSVLGMHFEGGCTLGRGVFGMVVDKRPASLNAVREKGAVFCRQADVFARTGTLPFRYVLMKKIVRIMQLTKKKLGL